MVKFKNLKILVLIQINLFNNQEDYMTVILSYYYVKHDKIMKHL